MTPQLDALLEQRIEQYLGKGASGNASSFLMPQDLEDIPTEELLETLSDAGLPCSQEVVGELTAAYTSSEEVFRGLVARYGVKDFGTDKDLLYFAVMELCRRWYPDWVSSDSLATAIRSGYDLFGDPNRFPDARLAADAWGKAWELVVQLARTWHVISVDAFDKRYDHSPSLRTWVNDFDYYLHESETIDQAYTLTRQSFARDFDRLFPRDLYDVLLMRRNPYGLYVSEYDAMQASYEEDHVIPFLDEIGPTLGSSAQTSPAKTKIKVGRNDPCPCGSGKKYKKCCGRGR